MIIAWKLGYEKSKKKAKKIYSKIGRVECPAFDNEAVIFNSSGFNHIIRRDRIPRPKNEQKRRFVLIPLIKDIIKNPKANISYRQQEITWEENNHGEKIRTTKNADFWTFYKQVKSCRVKVVVIGVGGKKYFTSVMGDNVSIDKGKK